MFRQKVEIIEPVIAAPELVPVDHESLVVHHRDIGDILGEKLGIGDPAQGMLADFPGK
jgi:hypothetical protein